MPETQIDESLEQYSNHVRAARNAEAPRSRAGDWALYTAAAGSALGLASAAEASIIYSGVQNATLAPASGQFSTGGVDLDGNGSEDVTLLLYFTPNAGIAGLYRGVGADIVLNGSNQVRRLFSGDTIGTSRALGNAGYLRGASANVTYGTWPGGNPTSSSGFAGIAFQAGSDTHFGWLRLRVRNDADGFPDQLTLVDWAYETDDNVSIQAGQVPEPSSFALLAAGCAGLAAYRRRQKASH